MAGDPLASRIRRVMQYADSIDKAVEILLAANNGLYSNEWLLADTKTNEIAMFELGTHKHKLWRSSKHEFPGGTEGFYWGCNNTKDLEVRKETAAQPGGQAGQHGLSSARSRRGLAASCFARIDGKIDASFGFKAFTTPPLAAFPSCDAKFTTTALAKELKSWALFGPPLGRTWDATPEETSKLPDIKPLVSNDWALVHVGAHQRRRVDCGRRSIWRRFPKPKKAADPKAQRQRTLPPAWHGTLLPEADGDMWLAAAFSDYEKIVALEKSLRGRPRGKPLDKLIATIAIGWPLRSLLRSRAGWRQRGGWAAICRWPQIIPQWDKNEWYAIAAGKGVMLLASLRASIGAGNVRQGA